MMKTMMMRRALRSNSIRLFSRAALLREVEYDYDKIHKLTQSPPRSELLIDVREPHEYQEGNIPTSLNLPLSRFEETLKLEPSQFESATGFPKPEKDEPVVFYCRAGVRSTSASKVAEALGYNKVGNYKGSWNDYSARQPAGVGAQGGRRAFSTSRQVLANKNPNEKDGTGEGAAGGIDLKKMNQKEEKRAEGRKAEEKKGSKLASAGDKESESVRSGAELSSNKKFE